MNYWLVFGNNHKLADEPGEGPSVCEAPPGKELLSCWDLWYPDNAPHYAVEYAPVPGRSS
jgi:hypothetical protein